MRIVIIGAGISGLSLAFKLSKYGYDFTIYEMSNNIGGVWNPKNGIVNEYSSLQVISNTFKFEDDYSEYTQFASADEVLKKINNNFNNPEMISKIKFNTELVNFVKLDNNKIRLKLKNNLDNTIQYEISDALYIRTGTLNSIRKLELKNEKQFKGVVCYGTNKNKNKINFENKVVTIVGFGATAIENTINAIQKGAKKVIIQARSLRNVWSRKMCYQIVKEMIEPRPYLVNMYRINSWKKINKLYNQFIDYFDLEITKQIRKDTTFKINNNLNYDLSTLPAINDDIFIYCYYGLLEIHKDEITNIESNGYRTKNNLYYKSDIIIKCTGYELNDNILTNHKSTNTIFVDNCYNITHNCGLDRAGKNELILGPDSEVNILPLISYPMYNNVLDELTIYFLQYPNRFTAFNQFDLYNNVISNVDIKNIEVKSYLYLFWKLITYLKFNIIDLLLTIRIGKHIYALRNDINNNLSEYKFNKINKELWNKTSQFCYQKDKNKEYLEYPY